MNVALDGVTVLHQMLPGFVDGILTLESAVDGGGVYVFREVGPVRVIAPVEALPLGLATVALGLIVRRTEMR